MTIPETYIPDVCPRCDIWVDFEKHHWMDTVALRPLTMRAECILPTLDELIKQGGEYLISRRGFDEWLYDYLSKGGYHFNVTAQED